MLIMRDTPSTVMYADLRSYGGLKNVDAARILLSAKLGPGGKTPRDRIESRTFLSREVVHASPEKVDPSIFADFFASTQTLYARVLAKAGGISALQGMTAHYGGPAAQEMIVSLEAFNLDAQIYRNEVTRLLHVRLRDDRDRPLLLFMLFCITGCLANPARAVKMVEDFAHSKLTQDLATVSVSVEDDMGMGGSASFGLLRVIGNVAQPPIHPLNPAGSVIGSLATGMGAITDVGTDVSRIHAHVWFDGARWLCEGLGSTNGTFIILGEDKSTVVVEPPRKQRNPKASYPPLELHESDMLCLGGSTRFLVLHTRAQG